eukprot:CAMPEP_0206001550 /NCGR_PEP_ID=MMETSP1464-20131121/2185_1 /ASSEMBLY_ACC=CAM_ASM_001124 /TAXON_ID=119497 /ORGANISM="Exanthemachrysis gayraliae, Strain RCC1523" /LENGTH=189 /DNA_ID=CAMNT_0053374867 /DNA_START=48 /DNA_END=617 /DNA_ORIENTATION=-
MRSPSSTAATVYVSFTSKRDGAAVHYKHDGSRFAQPHTLKLQAGECYNVELSVTGGSKPTIESAELSGRKLHLVKSRDYPRTFKAEWAATYEHPTANGSRDMLLLSVKVSTSDGAKRAALFPIQIKTYAPGSASYSSGLPLGQMHFDMDWSSALPASPTIRGDHPRFMRRTSGSSITSPSASRDIASAA